MGKRSSVFYFHQKKIFHQENMIGSRLLMLPPLRPEHFHFLGSLWHSTLRASRPQRIRCRREVPLALKSLLCKALGNVEPPSLSKNQNISSLSPENPAQFEKRPWLRFYSTILEAL